MSFRLFNKRVSEILQNASSPLCCSERTRKPDHLGMAEQEDGEDGIMINFFSQPDPARPFGLEVENHIFWIPKDGLCTYSPVFKNMLYGQFAESNRNTVKLPQKKAGEVHELLLCLFPMPVVKKVDDSNVDLLLDFADEYEIADLASRCSDYLQQKLDQLKNGDERLIEILVLASKHRLRQILFRMVERCADCFDLDKFEPYFGQLSSEVLGAIAWYKCQRLTKGRSNSGDLLQYQQFASLCNNCRNGYTQNRCTVCGGAQKCPLCSAIPRRSRPCACSSIVASLTRGASLAAMAESLDEKQDDKGGNKGKSFDGADLLLKRL